MPDFNQGSFTDVVNVINRLGITPIQLAGVLMLVGTAELTTDAVYKAWQTYQASAGYKSHGASARAAS